MASSNKTGIGGENRRSEKVLVEEQKQKLTKYRNHNMSIARKPVAMEEVMASAKAY